MKATLALLLLAGCMAVPDCPPEWCQDQRGSNGENATPEPPAPPEEPAEPESPESPELE